MPEKRKPLNYCIPLKTQRCTNGSLFPLVATTKRGRKSGHQTPGNRSGCNPRYYTTTKTALRTYEHHNCRQKSVRLRLKARGWPARRTTARFKTTPSPFHLRTATNQQESTRTKQSLGYLERASLPSSAHKERVGKRAEHHLYKAPGYLLEGGRHPAPAGASSVDPYALHPLPKIPSAEPPCAPCVCTDTPIAPPGSVTDGVLLPSPWWGAVVVGASPAMIW